MTTGPTKVQQSRANGKTTDSVYPSKYLQRSQDIDKWDHSFQKRFLGRISLYQYKEPPKRVLDLGCGNGLWVIDAAQEWTESSIVGFDLKNIQPNLVKAKIMPELASRIKWVHGNFLDPLPFALEYFDYVRIHIIGLGVPENKWQDLLQEVWRILRPGGHLQITEEDQTFPTGPPPPKLDLLPISQSDSQSSGSISPQSSTCENLLFPSDRNRAAEILSQGSGSTGCVQYNVDPRDHRRIAAAWKAMLRERFIAAQPVSILSFYLSSVFDRVDALPLLHIRLPPNSGLIEREEEDDSSNSSGRSKYDVDSQMTFGVQPMPPPSRGAWASDPTVFSSHSPLPASSGALHLARRFYTIVECKDAIWTAYESLYGDSPANDGNKGENSTQDEFEYHWSNWVDDMTDRIGMRRIMSSCTPWSVREFGDTPSSIRWRDRCGVIHADEAFDDSEPEETEMCRTVRSFLAWKS